MKSFLHKKQHSNLADLIILLYILIQTYRGSFLSFIRLGVFFYKTRKPLVSVKIFFSQYYRKNHYFYMDKNLLFLSSLSFCNNLNRGAIKNYRTPTRKELLNSLIHKTYQNEHCKEAWQVFNLYY
ncbi:MAG: hypothetical protein CSA15_01390 [Candidatus Delongbacteria bacterium]|nr:MAG: hypothetical protein CSA15_01390 [Candidatus Delongbacteria bacterium]